MDKFNSREIQLFRAVSEYINQLITDITLENISEIFQQRSEFSHLLKDYFLTKFSPKVKNRNSKLKEFLDKLEQFSDEKTGLIAIEIFKNMVRTNYFLDKQSIAFKIEVKNFTNLLKAPQPNYEMFVYDSEFMGVHLRMTKVSRGGLRWSERDDFREEIKSLMVTQDGKNSIIVPAGAKGGFVILKERGSISKEIFHNLYSQFINNLLDLVDNRDEKNNSNFINYDEVDSYFVVAADKGTAQMSDVANEISISRGFWLGDAFASGGTNGYSHKDLGITAKGSFVSTERFFLERGVDFYKESISIIGIGSMNGDVFGNGINLSQKFKLIGAISHREIFIDPNPNVEISYQERVRLFNSDNGAWSQYRKELISNGGGVFLKSDSNIKVSKEMKESFDISVNSISGNNLIKKMLTAKVDLLFNGGVGTYVKSTLETDKDVGDLGNSLVRVDAKNIQAFAVCEGGNLGFTQKARVEYSLNGGKINLDGIDNSAGVNISDHEVNIKILLSQTDLNSDENSKVLKNATDEVVNMVLKSSYNQALGLSLDENRSKDRDSEFAEITTFLEDHLSQFKRNYFAIPLEENFVLSRPNLAFLFSYSKIFITNLLLEKGSENNILDSFSNLEYLLEYFPKSLHQFQDLILKHPLHREIIATVIADKIINSKGVLFLANFNKVGKEEFLNILSRNLQIEKMVEADNVRNRCNRVSDYSKLIDFENRLTQIELNCQTAIKDI